MIDKATKEAYTKLLKDNTRLSALVKYREVELIQSIARGKSVLIELDTKYQEMTVRVLDYLVKNSIIIRDGVHYRKLCEIMPDIIQKG